MAVYLGQTYGVGPVVTSNACKKKKRLLDRDIYGDISKHQQKKEVKNVKRSIRLLKKERIKVEKKASTSLKVITRKMIDCVKENESLFDSHFKGCKGFIEKLNKIGTLQIKEVRQLYPPNKCQSKTDFNELILDGVKTIKILGQPEEVNEDLLLDKKLLDQTVCSMNITDIYIKFIKTHREEFNKVFGRADEYLKIFEQTFSNEARKILKNTIKYSDIKNINE